MSLNKCMIIGNLGRDPEMRYTPSGQAVTQFTVAVNRNYKDQQGERQEETEWFRVVAWGQQAEFAAEYLRKGAKVYVEGALQTRKWTDQSGQEKYTTEVVLQRFRGELTMLDGRGESGGMAEAHADTGGYPGPSSGGGGRSAPPGGDLDDEIPF